MLLNECPGPDETSIVCTDCVVELPLQVLRSGACWYLGYLCDFCGPYSRVSGYYATEAEANTALTGGYVHRSGL
jgi:hypothetical protein